MAAGMHHPLAGGGIGQAGALLYREGIHIHPQSHHGSVRRSELSHYPGAAHGLVDLPSRCAQLTRHQGRGLMFLTTELGMGMQVTPQLDQLGQFLIKTIQNAHPSSKARKAIS